MNGRQRVDPDLIISLILQRAPISRSDLAREAGVSPAAVTHLIQELDALGVVEDKIPTVSVGGRRSTGIRLDLRQYFMVALRIDRERLTFQVFDGSGAAAETTVIPIDLGIEFEPIVTLIGATIRGLLGARDERFLLGVSIASLGWLFEDDGEIILHADGFSELGKRDIRAEVQAMFPGVPVLLEHDAKTSALAEYQDHVVQTGQKPVCLLNIVGGIGFGGGIVIDGKIYRGSKGVAGEVGHLGINFNSAIYTRNLEAAGFNGLFEDYASPRALRQHVMSRLLEFPESSLTEGSTPQEIYAAFDAGDPLATWAVDRVCQFLAYGLAGLVFVLDPDVVVLVDAFPASDAVLTRIRSNLAAYLPSVLAERLDLKLSQRGTSGVLYGSYLLLLQWYLTNGQLFDRIRSSRAT